MQTAGASPRGSLVRITCEVWAVDGLATERILFALFCWRLWLLILTVASALLPESARDVDGQEWPSSVSFRQPQGTSEPAIALTMVSRDEAVATAGRRPSRLHSPARMAGEESPQKSTEGQRPGRPPEDDKMATRPQPGKYNSAVAKTVTNGLAPFG